MRDYVYLEDLALNKIKRRIGFSYFYFFFGPFYLIFKKFGLGLFLVFVYYFLLPIPGLVELAKIINKSFDNSFTSDLLKIIEFIRPNYLNLSFYLLIILCFILHMFLSFKIDNFLLKIQFRKRRLAPISTQDLNKLLYYKACPISQKLASDVFINNDLQKRANKIWDEQNFELTEMFKPANNSKKTTTLKKYNTDTSDLSKPYKEIKKTDEIKLLNKQHEDNLKLYKDKKITREEFEILEERLNNKK